MKLLAALMACSFLGGCSALVGNEDATGAQDAGVPEFPASEPAESTPDRGAPSGDSLGVPGTSDPDDAGSATTADGATPEPDGGRPAPGGPFAGARAYAARLGPSTLIKRHVFGGDNPAGQACLSCHKGAKGIPDFLFAGTIYADAARTKPAAKIEVRVRDAAGNAKSAYTDANGNFFFKQGALPEIAAPATAGLRDGTTTHVMANAINSGDCNSCHRAEGAGALHLP